MAHCIFLGVPAAASRLVTVFCLLMCRSGESYASNCMAFTQPKFASGTLSLVALSASGKRAGGRCGSSCGDGTARTKSGGRFGQMENPCYFCPSKGRMAEWSIAAVLKTVELQGSGGSNPSPSARQRGIRKSGCPFCRGFISLIFFWGLKRKSLADCGQGLSLWWIIALFESQCTLH